MSFLFRKLGWEVATEDKKNQPFSEVFDVVGAHMDLTRQHEGLVSVRSAQSSATSCSV